LPAPGFTGPRRKLTTILVLYSEENRQSALVPCMPKLL
jgi:hypothetical protein